MEKNLNELVQKLKTAAGANLKSVVLYGSAVTGEFHPKHSDFNVLCVLATLDPAELAKLNSTAAWWEGKGYPAPLVFTLDELQRSADVFAIELLDMKSAHHTLFGEDFLAGMNVPMNLHRLQVERELRQDLVRLRQAYLAAPRSRRTLMKLMTASISSFTTLFHHALIALGESAATGHGPGSGKRESIDRIAALLGFDATAFHAVLDVREGRRRPGDLDVEATFHGYFQAIERVTDEVDRRLSL